jgi:inorganic triphosphatase YgiF
MEELIMEVELAFTIAEDRHKIDKLPFWTGEAKTQIIISVYYDTPYQDVAKAGWSIRTRSIGDDWVQTVKGPTKAGQRVEIEVPIENDELSTEELRKTPVWNIIGLGVVNLRKVFKTTVVRTTRDYIDGLTVIEVASDQGQVQTVNGRTMIIDEVELELKCGSSEDLYRFACHLSHHISLRLQPESKAQRGYRLHSNTPPDFAKDAPTSVTQAMSTASAFRSTATSVMTHLISNLAAANAGSVDGVHQARVSLRRLRALFVMYKPFLSQPIIDAYDGEFQRLGSIFGAVRDWDVFEKDIIDVARRELRDSRNLVLISDVAAKHRRDALNILQKEIDNPKFTYLIVGLLRWINSGDNPSLGSSALNRPSVEQMPLLLDHMYNTAKRRRKRAKSNAEAMHRFRKSIKKLRYAAEYSEGVWNEQDVSSFIKPCKKLQTRLGHSNDIVMAHQLLDSLVVDDTSVVPVATELRYWLNDRQKRVNKKAVSSLKKFDSAKPYWR